MKKTMNVLLLAFLGAVLLAVPVFTALTGAARTTDFYENRTLAERPAFSTETFWSGDYFSTWETWYTDHAPGRTTLLKLHTKLDMALFKRPIVRGVAVQEEVLLPEMDYTDYTAADYEAAAGPIARRYGKLNDWVEAQGGHLYFIGCPEQRVYFADAFPDYMDDHAAEAQTADDTFFRFLEGAGVSTLDLREVYDAQGHPEAYYSRVDHHFHYLGAYAAYRAILDRLAEDGWDLPVLTEAELDFVALPNPYLGSRNRKLYDLWPNSEQAVIGVQKEPVPYVRYDEGVRTDRPLFVLPESDWAPTTYNLYMGGDFGETILETDRPELPDVLIFGDSFTNALETLLYASFDETRILDLRYYTAQSLKDYVADYQPDLVLTIQNDTFYYTTDGNGNVWED